MGLGGGGGVAAKGEEGEGMADGRASPRADLPAGEFRMPLFKMRPAAVMVLGR
jgi:hypothetical protein